MRCGVVVLPGSNCDHDVYHVLKHVLGQEVRFLWHRDDDLHGCELVVLPGGFSYGDYLRPGAIGALAPIISAVRRHAAAGALVLGIGNGFQVLLEAGLLPGLMRRNRSRRFECRDVSLRVERDDLAFTSGYRKHQVLRLPIAHGEGRYVATEAALEELEAEGRVVLRYASPAGEVGEQWNVSGSAGAIAGIANAEGNVLGMMSHPERRAEEIFGHTDGLAFFAAAVGAGSEMEVTS